MEDMDTVIKSRPPTAKQKKQRPKSMHRDHMEPPKTPTQGPPGNWVLRGLSMKRRPVVMVMCLHGARLDQTRTSSHTSLSGSRSEQDGLGGSVAAVCMRLGPACMHMGPVCVLCASVGSRVSHVHVCPVYLCAHKPCVMLTCWLCPV